MNCDEPVLTEKIVKTKIDEMSPSSDSEEVCK